jgi:hypothetical protein
VRRADARGNVVESTVDRYALRPAALTDGNGGIRRNTYDAPARLAAEFRPGDEPDAPTVTYRYLLDRPDRRWRLSSTRALTAATRSHPVGWSTPTAGRPRGVTAAAGPL